MDNENPFAQQTFQPEPMFTDDQKATDQPTEPSPKRKSRRSRRTTAAALSPASPAPVKRKYTRHATAPVATVPKPIDREFESELEIVTEIVTRLRALDAKARARVTAAVGKLL